MSNEWRLICTHPREHVRFQNKSGYWPNPSIGQITYWCALCETNLTVHAECLQFGFVSFEGEISPLPHEVPELMPPECAMDIDAWDRFPKE